MCKKSSLGVETTTAETWFVPFRMKTVWLLFHLNSKDIMRYAKLFEKYLFEISKVRYERAYCIIL